MAHPTQVAVIGCGIAGAAFAQAAADAGSEVVLFDKARGLGGRMSTRRAAPFTFDHGAQYFTTQSTPFRLAVTHWANAGVAATWDARFAEVEHGTWQPRDHDVRHWVGTPAMNAIVKHMVDGIDAHRACRIERLERHGRRWVLVDTEGKDTGAFDAVVVATPAAQAVPLLAGTPALAEAACAAQYAPCWALMLAFETALPLPFDAATLLGGPLLAWVARDSTKPGRSAPEGTETWVLHASADWSTAHQDETPEAVAGMLYEAFRTLPGAGDAPEPRERQVHRWLFARVQQPVGSPHLWDGELRIGACGDWCLGPRVEEAWRSGRSLAEAWAKGGTGRATLR